MPRHYRELSNQNQLRPQDVMRMLVHYHAYGDAAKVPTLVAGHSRRIRAQISEQEQAEIERHTAEYAQYAEKLERLEKEIASLKTDAGRAPVASQGSISVGADLRVCPGPEEVGLFSEIEPAQPASDKTTKEEDRTVKRKTERRRPFTAAPKVRKAEAKAIERKIEQLEKQCARAAAKIAERDERIAEAQRRAEDDRREVSKIGEELIALYADPDELVRNHVPVLKAKQKLKRALMRDLLTGKVRVNSLNLAAVAGP
jgi:type I restriction enzyme M protein